MHEDTQATGAEAPVETTATDTASNQPSEAREQVSEAPEANQSAGDTSSDVKAEDTAEEKLLAGKYKTVEDLEKSYVELQSSFSRTASEKAELTRVLTEAFTAPVAEAPSTEQDAFSDDSTSSDPRIEKLERQTAIATFAIAHPDADGDAINNIIANDPLISSIQGTDARLEYAYLKSQNMASSKAIQEAQKKGAQAAQAKAAEKQIAQVETTQKPSIPVDENAELKQRMTTGSVEDREAARREYIRKNLVNL